MQVGFDHRETGELGHVPRTASGTISRGSSPRVLVQHGPRDLHSRPRAPGEGRHRGPLKEIASGQTAAGRSPRDTLEKDALATGFTRIARKAASARPQILFPTALALRSFARPVSPEDEPRSSIRTPVVLGKQVGHCGRLILRDPGEFPAPSNVGWMPRPAVFRTPALIC